MTRKLIFSIVSFFLFGFLNAQNNWTLKTEDTYLSIAVRENAVYIDTLTNPKQQWNWTTIPSQAPLLNTVSFNGNAYTPNWIFQEATLESSSNERKLTLRFTSTNPALELKSVWSARSGPGPVENWIMIKNLTGGDVTYSASTAAANLQIKSNKTINLQYYDKTDVGIGKVYNQAIEPNANFNTNTRIMPFITFDVNSEHGLYIGYEWEVGGFNISSGTDPLKVNTAVYPISEDVRQGNNEIFFIPNVYYGVYNGDIDDGSNRFKKWFWNYKITRSLHNNTNEPWVESLITNGPTGPTGNTPQSYYDSIAVTGVECIKMDFWDGTGNCWYTNRDWMYHPEVWPNGFDYASKAHKAGLKASLYMGGTYNDVDLTTISGRDTELSAVLTRYDQGWFDMWRTDHYTAPYSPIPETYNGIKNFMFIQDSLMRSRPGYRYENCSNGGQYKGFAVCRRMTFCTMNDDGGNAISTRSTYYSNSFAINPVQLKSDHETPTAYDMRTDMMGAVLTTEEHNAIYREHIALYKSKQRPILRGGNVYHILPMPDGVNWDGLQYFNDSLNKGSVFLFKPSTASKDGDSKIIKLKGLDRSVSYQLTFLDRPYLNTSMTGAELMDNGIKVTDMKGDKASEIIWINDGPMVATTMGAGRCDAGQVTLQATATVGNLKWYASPNGGSSLGTGKTFTTPSISTTTTFYVEATDEVSASPRVAVVATISSTPPSPPVNTRNNQIVCSGQGITLSSKGIGTLSWYSDSLGGNYLGGGATYKTPPIFQKSSYFVQDSTCGASARTRIEVAVRTTPEIISTSPATRNDAGSLTLSATSSKGSVLNWYSGALGGSSIGTGTSFVTPTLNSTTTYYVDASYSGLQNLLTYSEQFDNAVWAKGNAYIDANTAETKDPLGGNSADKYICQTFTNGLPILNHNFALATPNTNSIYLKKGTAKWVALSIQGTGYCWFDIENGVIGSTGGAEPSAKSIESMGNGWYRCSLSYSSGNPFGFTTHIVTGNNVSSFDSDGSLYIYVWGAQLNIGNSSLPYQATTDEIVNNLGSECISERTGVTATITTVTELSKINENGFSIYPNPASDYLNISLSDYSGDVTIIITDLVGKIVLEKNITAEENKLLNFSVKGLNPGVYCVSVSGDKKYPIYKLMIE